MHFKYFVIPRTLLLLSVSVFSMLIDIDHPSE